MQTLLMLGAGREQMLAIEEAQRLGLRVVACDQNPEAPGLALADVHAVGDIHDADLMTEIGRENGVSGVFAHAVEIPDVVAEVARRLGLPGLDPEVAIRATNKVARITRLAADGIPCARFSVAHSEPDLIGAARDIGYPLVLKPADNAGARGVLLVVSDEELVPAYREALRYSRGTEVLLDEVLDGPQVSTESVVYQGVVHTFAFADRNYDGSEEFSPYFVEDGINFPSILPEATQAAIYSLVERTIASLGIDMGAAKGDVIVHNGVPKIIEMAARTSGGWFGAGSIPIATGANMLRPLLQMAVGDEPDLDALRPTRNLGCAQRYVIPRGSGVVRSVSGLDEALATPGVSMSEMFLPAPGEHICRVTNHAERLGQIICVGENRQQAIERCERAISFIKVEVDPDE
jgi:biotin carboxylase